MIRKTTLTNCTQTRGIVRKSHTTITRHQEDKQSEATSSLFPIEMIAKLQWTQSNAQQNIEQLQNPTMGVTINNRTTALDRTAAKATGGLKCILLVPNLQKADNKGDEQTAWMRRLVFVFVVCMQQSQGFSHHSPNNIIWHGCFRF